MFRKIKKWYFKIYHLFKLISVFILIFGLCNRVYAEEQYYCSKSVNKIETSNFVEGYVNPYGTAQPAGINWGITYNGVIEVEGFTDYSFTFMQKPVSNTPRQVHFMYYDERKNHINKDETFNVGEDYFRNTRTPSSAKYMVLGLGGVSAQEANSITSVLYKGKEYKYNGSITEPIIKYEDCYAPETPTQDNVYSSFLTLYTDKISYLANGFTTNPYLLAMIGIIFSFVVLELFLKILHIRGGKHR